MRNRFLLSSGLAVSVAFGSAAQAPSTGTIRGRVVLNGKLVGNPIIRMGVDPKCSQLNAGKRVVQESAAVSLDGSVGNVFVHLEGTFPPSPVPEGPVVISQKSCIYGPRVVGVRVGQLLQIRNDDELLHNVHSESAANHTFNVGQPKAGIVFDYKPKRPEVMLKLGCDIHRWMTAYIGVMAHPYFAVTNGAGTFAIANVPLGSHTIRAWHERFGEVSQTVTVKTGATETVDFSYTSPTR